MDQYELIRTGYRVYGKSISELARLTGHSRNTVKKAIRGEPWGYRERHHQPLPALGKYLKIIDGWLVSDKDKPCKQRHTARRIYNRLVHEHGFKGSESSVRRYVRLAKCGLGWRGPVPSSREIPKRATKGRRIWAYRFQSSRGSGISSYGGRPKKDEPGGRRRRNFGRPTGSLRFSGSSHTGGRRMARMTRPFSSSITHGSGWSKFGCHRWSIFGCHSESAIRRSVDEYGR
jgi:hypothetical protein